MREQGLDVDDFPDLYRELIAPAHIVVLATPIWLGDPSFLDGGRGARNHWTTRSTVFAAWNLLHAARRITDQGGVPAHGNLSSNWDLTDPQHPNPEYR